MRGAPERSSSRRAVAARERGVLSGSLDDIPITVFAVETTGFPAGRHRICELSLCRLTPDGRPTVVFDSLIRPERPVTGQAIHGLRDADLEGAPRFEEVAATVIDALAGSVLAAYNATFAIDFLCDELARCGISRVPPHFCLMFLRPVLGLGPRCSLEEACLAHAVPFDAGACSRAGAEAAAGLLHVLRSEMAARGWRTFGDLAARCRRFPFVDSLSHDPLPHAEDLGLEGRARSVRRVVRPLGAAARADKEAVRRYWSAVSVALADDDLSDVEVGLVVKLRELLGLSEEQVRAVHARALVAALVRFGSDDWLSDAEADKLERLLDALSRLGWSPSDPR